MIYRAVRSLLLAVCYSGNLWLASGRLAADGSPGSSVSQEEALESLSSRFSATAEVLQTWADQQPLPWPVRPVAEQAEFPRESLATLFDQRWDHAPPPLRVAYGRLAYVQAYRSDQWHQITGESGFPHLDAYLAALSAPLSQALLALDGLRRTLAVAEPPPAGPSETIRVLLRELAPPPAGEPLGPLVRELGGPLRLSGGQLVRDQAAAVVSTSFPAVRGGAELAVYLTLLAGIAAEAAPQAPTLALLLHEQGLPLLEVELPAQAAHSLLAGDSDLSLFWRSWALWEYLAERPLVPLEFFPSPGDLPEGWQVKSPRSATAAAMLSLAGLGARVPPGEARGAAQVEITDPGGAVTHAGVLVGTTPEAMRSLAQGAVAAAPAGVRAASHGPVLWIVSGSAPSLDRVAQVWQRVSVVTGQPTVEMPPPVLASLRIKPLPPPRTAPPPSSQTAPSASPAPSGLRCVRRALMCTGVDERNRPLGVSDRFPTGTSKVGLYFECEDAPPNTELVIEWRREGTPIMRQRVIVSGSRHAVSYIAERNNRPLPDGAYEVRFTQGGKEVYVVRFKID